MLGKLVVHGPDRATAIARLSRALSEYEITGVETTLPLFRALVRDPEFGRAEFDVQWLDRRLAADLLAPAAPSAPEVFLAAAGRWLSRQSAGRRVEERRAPLSAWTRASRTDALR